MYEGRPQAHGDFEACEGSIMRGEQQRLTSVTQTCRRVRPQLMARVDATRLMHSNNLHQVVRECASARAETMKQHIAQR